MEVGYTDTLSPISELFAHESSAEKPSEYSLSGPAVSPQASHLSGVGIPRPTSASTSRNMAPTHTTSQHPESWRQHNAFAPGSAPSTSFLTDASQTSPASWRAQDGSESQASGTSADRNQWPASTTAYGYQERTIERTPSYQSPAISMPYPAHSQPAQFQTISAGPVAQNAVGATFHTPGVPPHPDFQTLSLASSSNFAAPQVPGYHEQHSPHTAYQVSPGQHSAGFPGNPQDVQRSLAPPTYNASAGSPQFMHAQPNHGIAVNYREGQAQPYGYNT